MGETKYVRRAGSRQSHNEGVQNQESFPGVKLLVYCMTTSIPSEQNIIWLHILQTRWLQGTSFPQLSSAVIISTVDHPLGSPSLLRPVCRVTVVFDTQYVSSQQTKAVSEMI